MKIVYHHRTLGDGAEGIHVSSVVDAFQRLGHDVRVVALIGERTNVSNPRTRMLTFLARMTPRLLYELLELGYSLVGYRALSTAIRASRPDFIYERYTLFNLAGILAARRHRLRIVLEVNAPLAFERARYERLALKRLAQYCEARICRLADAVVVVSTPLKAYLVDQGVAPDRITIVPNGADPDEFRPDPRKREAVRRRHGIPPDAVVAGFIGILRPWHGVDMLLEAAALVRASGCPVWLLIVGDGPSLAELKTLSSKRGLDDFVRFTGRVPHDAIPEYVAAFDIGVSPRATFYASPMKIPEYMAAGVPVIAPRMANITDLVTEGIDSECFEPESVDDLASALQQLASNPDHRTRLARAARQSILEHRSWRHVAAALASLGG